MHQINKYRLGFSRFLLIWMLGIITSGVVFMHKEVTSTGEIVTHIHPYNLGEKKHHHHHSDAEIRFLDIVFQGSYLNWEAYNYEAPIQQVILEGTYAEQTYPAINQEVRHRAGRDPPFNLA